MTPTSSISTPTTRTCERTGLRLVASANLRTFRVAQTSYGPIAPLPREGSFKGVRAWARWDTAGGRTIYVAEDEQFAYLEVLAYLKPSQGLATTTLAEAFPDSDDPADRSQRAILDQIRAEWAHKFAQFGPGKNPLRWREARAVYAIELPSSGWFVDMCHSDTVAALNRTGGALNGPFHSTHRVTLANLFDENRRWSCRVATLLRQASLDDGSLPHGVTYLSKHGANGRCWAFWLRRIDDGMDPSTEPLRVSGPCEIKHPQFNPPLAKAAQVLGLTLL